MAITIVTAIEILFQKYRRIISISGYLLGFAIIVVLFRSSDKVKYGLHQNAYERATLLNRFLKNDSLEQSEAKAVLVRNESRVHEEIQVPMDVQGQKDLPQVQTPNYIRKVFAPIETKMTTPVRKGDITNISIQLDAALQNRTVLLTTPPVQRRPDNGPIL